MHSADGHEPPAHQRHSGTQWDRPFLRGHRGPQEPGHVCSRGTHHRAVGTQRCRKDHDRQGRDGCVDGRQRSGADLRPGSGHRGSSRASALRCGLGQAGAVRPAEWTRQPRLLGRALRSEDRQGATDTRRRRAFRYRCGARRPGGGLLHRDEDPPGPGAVDPARSAPAAVRRTDLGPGPRVVVRGTQLHPRHDHRGSNGRDVYAPAQRSRGPGRSHRDHGGRHRPDLGLAGSAHQTLLAAPGGDPQLLGPTPVGTHARMERRRRDAQRSQRGANRTRRH